MDLSKISKHSSSLQQLADKDSVSEAGFVGSNKMLLKIINKFKMVPKDDFG